MSDIRARAEVLFYVDSFDKPQVILTGRWSARDINKAGALLLKAYRIHLRAVQRGEKALDEPMETEIDIQPPSASAEEELSKEE